MRATKLVNTPVICPVAHASSSLFLAEILKDPGADETGSHHRGGSESSRGTLVRLEIRVERGRGARQLTH